MTPELIRSLWSLIERLPSDILVTHSQEEFIDFIIEKLQRGYGWDKPQIEAARDYLKSKVLLICELSERDRFAESPYLSA